MSSDIQSQNQTDKLRRSGQDRRSVPRVETLKAFSERTGAPTEARNRGQQPHKTLKGRVRTPLSNISFPEKTRSMSALRAAYRATDVLAVTTLIMLSIWTGYIGMNGRAFLAPIAAGFAGAIGFIFMLWITQAHRFAPTESYRDHMKKVTLSGFAALGIWLGLALFFKPETFQPDSLARAGFIAMAGLLILHSLYFAHIQRQHKEGQLIPTIVMLGATEAARRLIEENAKTRELNILAIFDERLSRAPHNIHGVPVVGRIEDMLGWDALPYIDRIVVTLPSKAEARIEAFIAQVRLLPNRIAFVVDEFETLDHVHQRLTQIAEIGMRDVTGKPKSGLHMMLKRLMDIVVSSTALILGAPVLLIVALWIKIDSPGPVLFKQPRHGFNNRVFDVYKFRSMRNDAADLKAAQQTVAGDARITKIGRFIRKTSIDELPQLLNVLRGDMSLVGPRPHAIGMRTGDVESYKLVEEYAHRHKVKPGMTGWAQINGSRGPLHKAEDVATRVRLDVEYIENSNVLWDIVICLKTLPCLLGDNENIR